MSDVREFKSRAALRRESDAELKRRVDAWRQKRAHEEEIRQLSKPGNDLLWLIGVVFVVCVLWSWLWP